MNIIHAESPVWHIYNRHLVESRCPGGGGCQLANPRGLAHGRGLPPLLSQTVTGARRYPGQRQQVAAGGQGPHETGRLQADLPGAEVGSWAVDLTLTCLQADPPKGRGGHVGGSIDEIRLR